MRRRTPTQPVLALGLQANALLLDTDDQGNERCWRVRCISKHPAHQDRLIVSGETNELMDLHISDWVHRVIEN